MEQAYLFTHFKEKETPDGEQVYFGISKDGYNWEEVNGGKPVLWSKLGEKGVRDITVFRTHEGKTVILATDLCLATNFKDRYMGKWMEVSRSGSHLLAMWESTDLVHWSEQKMIDIGQDSFGCMWAPEVFEDHKTGEYVVHWSSSDSSNDFGNKSIYYAKTKDFVTFTKPAKLYSKSDAGIIDSDIQYKDGTYYRFTKSENNPSMVIMEKGSDPYGEFERVYEFDEEMSYLRQGMYEAPAAYELPDGKWCLMIDFYGCPKDEMGYVPFICDDIKSGRFVPCEDKFHFPYGFKHGNVVKITLEEYERIKNYY